MLTGTYNISKATPNPFTGAVYSCLMVQAGARFGTKGDEWMIGFDSSETDENMRHHLIAYGIHVSSSLLQQGGILENVEDGDIIYDCSSITSSKSPPVKQLHTEQVGNVPLDFLSMFNDNNSTTPASGGYKYGMPIGARTEVVLWAIEMHAHVDMFEPDAQVPIKIHVKGTTDAPDKDVLGMVMYGVNPPFPGVAKELLMNIPINSDGQYTITSGSRPAAPFCNAYVYPDAVECESCCPNYPFVYPNNWFELRMEQSGLPYVDLISSHLHYHHLGVSAVGSIVSLDGTETLVDAQFNHENSLHALSQPLRLTSTDGLKMKCTYERHGNMTTNIIGGYTTSEEMCLGFSYYTAPVDVPFFHPGLLYGDICNTVQNEGYANENDPMDDTLTYLGIPKQYICRGSCANDPIGCPN